MEACREDGGGDVGWGADKCADCKRTEANSFTEAKFWRRSWSSSPDSTKRLAS